MSALQSSDGGAEKCAFVYILGCDSARGLITYVGWTHDLDARLAAHNRGGGAKSTRGRAWRLLYAELLADKSKAMSREWALKRDRGFRLAIRTACCE
jgi:putative endonuclease